MTRSAKRPTSLLSVASDGAPLLVSVLLFVQLSMHGLLPALEHSRRLEKEETRMEARWESLCGDAARLADERRMLADEIYRERVRRTLRDPHQLTLTLERAREWTRASLGTASEPPVSGSPSSGAQEL